MGNWPTLTSVVELEIIDKVDLTGATTIKVALDRVEEEFMKTHPLINRRVEFLTMNQKEGQLMSEHIVKGWTRGRCGQHDSRGPEGLSLIHI